MSADGRNEPIREFVLKCFMTDYEVLRHVPSTYGRSTHQGKARLDGTKTERGYYAALSH